MAQILVNGAEHQLDPACLCWGDALQELDRRVEHEGRVLTAVRFDGVDQPTFRDGAFDAMPLDEFAVVEAEAVRPRDLLLQTVDEAERAARTLSDAALRLGGTFRGFDVSHANQDLVELAQGVGTLVGVVQGLARATGVPLESLEGAGGNSAGLVERLSQLTDELIDAQEAEDWISVADVLEYDIAPALGGWALVVHSLRQAIPA